MKKEKIDRKKTGYAIDSSIWLIRFIITLLTYC